MYRLTNDCNEKPYYHTTHEENKYFQHSEAPCDFLSLFYLYCIFSMTILSPYTSLAPAITTMVPMLVSPFPFLLTPYTPKFRPSTQASCRLLSIYEFVSVLLVSSVCSLDSTNE